MTQIVGLVLCAILVGSAVGCNSPAGIAMQVVGKAVDDVETTELGEQLRGQSAAAADKQFGTLIDSWSEVNGPRQWRVYPVEMDVMGNQRNVVQLSDGEIVAVTKVKIDATGVDLARKLMLDEKVKGKSPQGCEAALGMGPPLVTARSNMSKLLAQLYDAKTLPGIGSPQYCRLKFNSSDLCTEAALVDVSASTVDNPAGN